MAHYEAEVPQHLIKMQSPMVNLPTVHGRKNRLGIAAVLPLFLCHSVASAQNELSGQQVVEMTCISCHGNNRVGAPRIGDTKAWEKRARLGAEGLSQPAIAAVRTMKAHRGNMELSDAEIASAIAYMVNQSGGKLTEPGGATVTPRRN